MARPQPYCYAAMMPVTAQGASTQQVIWFKFGDSSDPNRDLQALAAYNPSIVSTARNVTPGKGNFQGYANAGIWLKHVVFQNRGFAPARGANGAPTDWYLVYLRTNQASTIRAFLRDWDRMAWDLTTAAGQQNLVNYLNGTVFPQVSSRPQSS